MPTDSSENQLNPSYYLRLAAAIIILAAVWFGTNIFGKQNPPVQTKNQEQTTENQEQTAVSNPNQQTDVFAASLPISQNAFLISSNDLAFPIRKWGIDEPELSAQSTYAFDLDSGKVLASKEPDNQRPIASLSKLVTALVIMDKANLADQISVDKTAVETEGEMGGLVVNEKLTPESLLWIMLMESSNDAAVALAEHFSAQGGSTSGGDGQFINFMNQKAATLGLRQTQFADPSGLSTQNLSTAKEVAQIMAEAIKIPLLAQIMRTSEKEIFSADNKFIHQLKNTDKLLATHPEIISGKTGYIDEAGGCIAVAAKAPNNQETIINVILGSQDRFGDMEKLLNWEKEGFVW